MAKKWGSDEVIKKRALCFWKNCQQFALQCGEGRIRGKANIIVLDRYMFVLGMGVLITIIWVITKFPTSAPRDAGMN